MRNWLIPAIALLAINVAGIGVGWSISEWRDGDEAPVRTEQAAAPVQTGPTQAELDAQRCSAALQALGLQTLRDVGTAELQDAVKRYCH